MYPYQQFDQQLNPDSSGSRGIDECPTSERNDNTSGFHSSSFPSQPQQSSASEDPATISTRTRAKIPRVSNEPDDPDDLDADFEDAGARDDGNNIPLRTFQKNVGAVEAHDRPTGHDYLVKLCKALMNYGAPSHRLEGYMEDAAKSLNIIGDFFYQPGHMTISFDDPLTHTTSVKHVRTAYDMDLGKLPDTHDVNENVVHDDMRVGEAIERLDEIQQRKDAVRKWWRVFAYGCASAFVGPFAFEAGWWDMLLCVFFGCILGALELIRPRPNVFGKLLGILAVAIISCVARALGSINDGDLFCFSAIARSSIALTLPVYDILCASLELQSQSIVSGSARMMYSIVYSLLLGYGIAIGALICGLIYKGLDADATSDTKCKNSLPRNYNFFFVPLLTFCIMIVSKAKLKQAPAMILIAFVSYIPSHFLEKPTQGNAHISTAASALAIGLMANTYSRFLGCWLEKKLEQWRRRPRLATDSVANICSRVFGCRLEKKLEQWNFRL